jgi:hypothetical protein
MPSLIRYQRTAVGPPRAALVAYPHARGGGVEVRLDRTHEERRCNASECIFRPHLGKKEYSLGTFLASREWRQG